MRPKGREYVEYLDSHSGPSQVGQAIPLVFWRRLSSRSSARAMGTKLLVARGSEGVCAVCIDWRCVRDGGRGP